MTIYASKSLQTFLDDAVYSSLPKDAVKISAAYRSELLTAKAAGMMIDWSGEVPVAVEPQLPSLPEKRRLLLAEINSTATELLAKLSASYPIGEVQSWGQQTREAEALAIDPNATATLLTAIATARGLTITELATRVQAKVAAFAVASGQIIGQRQALEDALMAIDLQAPDAAEQLEAITWPVS